jgi:hypothetical protein
MWGEWVLDVGEQEEKVKTPPFPPPPPRGPFSGLLVHHSGHPDHTPCCLQKIRILSPNFGFEKWGKIWLSPVGISQNDHEARANPPTIQRRVLLLYEKVEDMSGHGKTC